MEWVIMVVSVTGIASYTIIKIIELNTGATKRKKNQKSAPNEEE